MGTYFARRKIVTLDRCGDGHAGRALFYGLWAVY
jgi:hypothetical protein